jgi:hypothetical protein
MRKQQPAEEVEPVIDDARLEKVSRAISSRGPPKSATSEAGKQPSVWDQWLATQRDRSQSPTMSMKDRIASRRAKSARRPDETDRSRFDSALATGSGYTNTGKKATVQREGIMAAAAAREKAELDDLQELLGRTLYTGGGNNFKRAGDVATSTLQKLNDGQADDIGARANMRGPPTLPAARAPPPAPPPAPFCNAPAPPTR